ncbi:MAG TPA: hypothetical protein VLL54_12935 [Pyrinomonadaceae bacterium]|nr:hypothetical protein [Pyrinomonadaceae bacterium]
MSVAATQILGFLERRQTFTFERNEIAHPEFENMRRNLRQIVMKFHESDDYEAAEIAKGVRTLLSEWLTTPITFDTSIERSLTELFGDRATISSRWGFDIAGLYEAARKAAVNLATVENPVRKKLKETIEKVHLQELRFKIYCHRRAKHHFDSLLASLEDVPVTEDMFLHSVRDYRDSETFDVLIKVGPLRSKGSSSAPDAILTAPRFEALELIVWSGSSDEPGFGYDPSQAFHDDAPLASSWAESASRLPKWSVQRSSTGTDHGLGGLYETDWDELSVFAQKIQLGENRAAKLVHVDEEHGIFYQPYSRVLSFNPPADSRQPIGWRIPGETLVEGMFVIVPNLGDVGLGDLQARNGYYSRIWKSQLREEVISNLDELVERLRSAGLDLMHLHGAIRNWYKEPGTVIHAPQKSAHFEILIRVLGVDDDPSSSESHSAIPWWKRAWMEIRSSRGEAIQAGQLEQELVDEQLMTVLASLLPDLTRLATEHRAFELAVPPSSGMSGVVNFLPVTAIEAGFSVPDGQFRVVQTLAAIDQWRD